jgi:hypothetical protein
MQYWYKRFVLLILILSVKLVSYSQTKIDETVYFEFDSDALTVPAKVSLNSIILLVTPLPNYTIRIEGYTDEKGTQEYNYKLANKRAKAVADYLTHQGIDTAHFTFIGAGEQIPAAEIPDPQKRKSVITITVEKDQSYSFYGKYGTEVIATDSIPLNITEYFSTESMLRDSIYALDEDNAVLETGGMLTICKQDQQLDASGKFYIVKIPARRLPQIETMDVWIAVKNKWGQVRWQLTTIKLVFDQDNEVVTFKVPVGTQNCITLNLDRRCGPFKNSIVYISTYKPFNFSDITIRNNYSSLSFSAKLNDTLYAFVKHNDYSTKTMRLIGNAVIDGKDSILEANLNNCIYTEDSNANEHYFLCEKCFVAKMPIVVAPPDVVQPVKKAASVKHRRGFFQWIADLFRKKKG